MCVEVENHRTDFETAFNSEVNFDMRYRRKLFKTAQGFFALAIPKEVASDLVGGRGGDVWIAIENGWLKIKPVKTECA